MSYGVPLDSLILLASATLSQRHFLLASLMVWRREFVDKKTVIWRKSCF